MNTIWTAWHIEYINFKIFYMFIMYVQVCPSIYGSFMFFCHQIVIEKYGTKLYRTSTLSIFVKSLKVLFRCDVNFGLTTT